MPIHEHIHNTVSHNNNWQTKEPSQSWPVNLFTRDDSDQCTLVNAYTPGNNRFRTYVGLSIQIQSLLNGIHRELGLSKVCFRDYKWTPLPSCPRNSAWVYCWSKLQTGHSLSLLSLYCIQMFPQCDPWNLKLLLSCTCQAILSEQREYSCQKPVRTKFRKLCQIGSNKKEKR